jgi:hypothetical protein
MGIALWIGVPVGISLVLVAAAVVRDFLNVVNDDRLAS